MCLNILYSKVPFGQFRLSRVSCLIAYYLDNLSVDTPFLRNMEQTRTNLKISKSLMCPFSYISDGDVEGNMGISLFFQS